RRTGQTWPRERVIGWDLVHGSWTQNRFDTPQWGPCNISELQVRVKDVQGQTHAYAIVGANGEHTSATERFGPKGGNLYIVADELAKSMRVPLSVVHLEQESPSFGWFPASGMGNLMRFDWE